MPYERDLLSDIIRSMLTPDPEKRPDIKEIERVFNDF